MPRENHSPPIFSPPHYDNPFLSPHSLVFPPNTSPAIPSPPSSSSSSNSDLDTSLITTDLRLYQSRLLLQNDQLRHRYNLCRTHLHDLLEDSESLRMRNAQLRQSNQDLVNKLSLFKSQRNLLEEFRRISILGHHDPVYPPTTVIHNANNNNNTSLTAAALPKSISVRSTGYRKSSRPVQTPRPLDVDRDKYVQRVANRRRQEGETEMEVYDQQGMEKTELCNKWQETGGCWYGESCQFAHGIEELRPVIRHPRYKTQVCKMVLRGGKCPYAHRCHFRHALTDQASLPF